MSSPVENRLPASFDVLYSDAIDDSLRSYEPLTLTTEECVAILSSSLAKDLFGLRETPTDDVINELKTGKKSYIDFVTGNAAGVLLKAQSDSRSSAIVQSQIIHLIAACLALFLQSNVTGPPLPPTFHVADALVPVPLRKDASSSEDFRAAIIRHLTTDGVAVNYTLIPNIELLPVAIGLIRCDALFAGNHVPLIAYSTRLRVNFLHQKLLNEPSDTLQGAIYSDLDILQRLILPPVDEETKPANRSTRNVRAQFLIERAVINIHHAFDAEARADLESASAQTGFEFALTGVLGKRTKFQQRDVSQLVVLARSATDDENNNTGADTDSQNVPARRSAPVKPAEIDLNDDTLLESISFKKTDDTDDEARNEEIRSPEKSMSVQSSTDLSPTLASLDASEQPILHPIDSLILLAIAFAVTNLSPQDGLTREETAPYASRVLHGGSSNWQVYSQALLVRSKIEGYRSRTAERGLLQLQTLVDQVIAEMTEGTSASVPAPEEDDKTAVNTFMPRAAADDSAPAHERLRYIWFMDFSTRWNLEVQLANRWASLGGLKSALDIYERLHMWAEVALCYAATDREEMARRCIRKQLFSPITRDGEEPVFEGPEVSPLPADAPRLFCILGDIDTDPAMYERAWEVSNCRFARAQRSLARYYLSSKPPRLGEAESAFEKSLKINYTNHGAWFTLGCVQLQLQKFESAVSSFTRVVQMQDEDAEAWSNLAVALINIPVQTPEQQPQTTTEAENTRSTPADDEDESMVTPRKEPVDPYKHKRQALLALFRAAKFKRHEPRIWDNILTVASSIPPPDTPIPDIVVAQKRLIEICGSKMGEKCVDIKILTALVKALVAAPYDAEITNRHGTTSARVLALLDEDVVPLITSSPALWSLVATVEEWRGNPGLALDILERAWRAAVANGTQAAFQMGDETAWNKVVAETEKLVREGYRRLGMKVREGSNNNSNGGPNSQESQLVAPDWRFKSRSAIRSVLGKGKQFFEDSEEWQRLRDLQAEMRGEA